MPIEGVRLNPGGQCERFSAYSAGSHYIVGEQEGGPIYQLSMECCCTVPEPDHVLCVFRQPHAIPQDGESVALPPPLDAILFDASLVFLSWCISRKEWQTLDATMLQRDIANMALYAEDYAEECVEANLHWVEYRRLQNALVDNHTDLYHHFKKPPALERKEARGVTTKRMQVDASDDHSDVDEPSVVSSDSSSDEEESTIEDASESETANESSDSEDEAEDEEDDQEGAVESEDDEVSSSVDPPPLRRAPSRRCKKI